MNIEIWKRFIYKRDELFKNVDKKLIQGIKLVQELIHEDNTSVSFDSEVETSTTKATSEEKFTATLELNKTTKKNNARKIQEKKIQNPMCKKGKTRLQ